MKNNFRILLAKKKKKIKDVHEATGISKTTLLSLWNEETKPDITTIMKVAEYLECTPNDLLLAEE